jgi:hypothetical protein
MKREEMREKVNEELKHIPHSFRGSSQNMLREYYNAMRMTDLKRNPACPAKETLVRAEEMIKKDKPDFSPFFDREFFRI